MPLPKLQALLSKALDAPLNAAEFRLVHDTDEVAAVPTAQPHPNTAFHVDPDNSKAAVASENPKR